MIDPHMTVGAVQAIGPDTPAARLAIAVASIRNGAPFSPKSTPYGSMEHWRTVVLEVLLLEALRAEL